MVSEHRRAWPHLSKSCFICSHRATASSLICMARVAASVRSTARWRGVWQIRQAGWAERLPSITHSVAAPENLSGFSLSSAGNLWRAGPRLQLQSHATNKIITARFRGLCAGAHLLPPSCLYPFPSCLYPFPSPSWPFWTSEGRSTSRACPCAEAVAGLLTLYIVGVV